MAKQKYFLAIIPPEPLFSEVENIKKQVSISYNNKSALRSPAHITLHMPFEWNEEKEGLLIEKLNEFQFGNSFNIQLKNFSCFEPKVLFIDVVKNDDLSRLQSRLVEQVKLNLNIFNQANDLRAYHPHVTIAFRDLKKESFYKAWEELKNRIFEADFKAKSFVLLKHTGSVWQSHQQFAQ